MLVGIFRVENAEGIFFCSEGAIVGEVELVKLGK
jgi:hypothetical protein